MAVQKTSRGRARVSVPVRNQIEMRCLTPDQMLLFDYRVRRKKAKARKKSDGDFSRTANVLVRQSPCLSMYLTTLEHNSVR